MKLVTQQSKVRLTGDIKQHEFTIVASPKMFKVLADGYADKITAIVREISTNAYDSHVEAGCPDKPFDVEQPTFDSPYFSVRDYGIGMSPEDVLNVFTKFGKSTKEDSNDGVGCLGLGSKTPFHYNTKTFTVESYHNGTKYIYSCFLNDIGIPSLAETYRGETNEPNGVKVTIPTGRYDFDSFSQSMKAVYAYFPVLPNVVHGNVALSKINYIMSGSNWGMRSDGGSARVVMGPVSYAIPHGNLDDPFLGLPIDLIVDIGDVDIDPYRENINVDNRTKLEIVSCLKVVAKEIVDNINATVAGSKSLWSARITAADILSKMPSFVMSKIDTKNLSWNGIKLYDNIFGQVSLNKFGEVLKKYYKMSHRANAKSAYVSNIECSSETKIIFNDLKVGSAGRCCYYCTQNSKSNIGYNRVSSQVFLITPKDDSEKQHIINHLGLTEDDYILASSLPKPVVTNRTLNTNNRSITTLVKFDSSIPRRAKNSYWHDERVDISKGGVYVTMNIYDAVVGNRTISPESFRRIVTSIEKITNKQIGPIYGVRKNLLSKISKSNWVDFKEFAQEKLNEACKDINMEEASHCLSVLHQLQSYPLGERTSMILLVANDYNGCDLINSFKKDYDIAVRFKDISDSISLVRHDLMKIFDIKFKESTFKKLEAERTFEKIIKKYPLIEFLSRPKVDNLVEYVTLVNNNS